MIDITYINIYANAFRRIGGSENSVDINPGKMAELAQKLRAKADRYHAHSRAAWDALKDDTLPDYIWDAVYEAAGKIDDIYYKVDAAADEMELAAQKWDELMEHLDRAFDEYGEATWKEV